MYNSYFGFSRSPFENNLDQRFLFLSKDYREGLAALLYFAETKKGFAIVCGDVGTGKSMLINSFLDRLPDSAQPIMMLNPCASSLDILIHIAETLKVRITGNESLLQLTNKVTKALTSAKLREKSFVLIIDEAHLLSDQALEEIRLLSNIETPDQKLLQILLVGQYELSHKLDRPEMRHLRQRININRFLSPLNPEETIQYIDHRLKQVDSSFAAVFEDQCRSLIFKLTGGCPRLINQLCDNALLIGMIGERRKVNRKVLEKAHEAWRTYRVLTPKSSRALTYRGMGAITYLVVVAGSVVVMVLLMVLLGIMAIKSGWGVVNFQSVFQKICAAIPIAGKPPALSVATSKDLQAAKESPQWGRVGEPEGAPAPSLKPSAAAPKPAPLPEGFGRMEVKGPISSGEPPALSPPGQSEIKPGSAGELKLAAEMASKKEEQAKPQGALPELGGTPLPSPGPAPAQVPPAARQLIPQAGESLGRIANRSYPANNKLGLAALILANPEIDNEDKILPGQALYLPEINFPKETIRLKDQRFYAIYGHYQSAASLEKDISWLEKKQAHFVIRYTKGVLGMVVHRVFLGGYETEEELAEALKSVNLKSPYEPKITPAPIKGAGEGAPEVKQEAAPSPHVPEGVKQEPKQEEIPPPGTTPKNKEKVDSGAPESPSVQLKPGGESPVTEPLPAPPAFEQLVTQGGESLTRIASQRYPKDPRFGIAAMILQNPHVTKVDVIKPEEVLYFPKINFENRTIQLKDNLWYAFYGRYPSPERANKITFWFTANEIKFLVRDIKSGGGITIKRIFIGGYATEEELTQALNSLTTKKK